ncbi:MAG: C69 family dipeptidase [Candidatus Zixiibacteriota bacterium]
MVNFSLFKKVLCYICFISIVLSPASYAFDNCYSIVVGKDASADGFVLMAHNEDDGPPQIVNHHKVPRKKHYPGDKVRLINGGELEQVEETWSYIWSEIPGLMFSDSYVNEWGLCITSDNCPSREDNPVLPEGGISYYLRRLIAERAKTSREGVHLLGELIERFGYDASGRTYIVSDPLEGWLVCAVNGTHWAAARVPDDEMALIANTYTVHNIDLSDTMNFLGSDDIIDYAIERGWYDPKQDGEFDFAKAYADPEVAIHPGNIGRQYGGLRLVSPVHVEIDGHHPFSLKPKKKMDVPSLMAILRDHYEGTEHFGSNSPSGNPHDRDFRSICRHDTQTSFVVQLRNDMPLDIGVVYWVCLASPCVSTYIPFHIGNEVFPDWYLGSRDAPTDLEFEEKLIQPFQHDYSNAFWTFSNLRYKAEKNYNKIIESITIKRNKVEKQAFDNQESMEKWAIQIYDSDKKTAMEILNNYSRGIYLSSIRAMGEIIPNN